MHQMQKLACLFVCPDRLALTSNLQNDADGALRAEQPFTAHPCYDRHSDRLVAFSNGIRHGEGAHFPPLHPMLT